MSTLARQTPLDLAAEFSRFRAAHGERLHFAAHSHHFWPDVTRVAQQLCWDEAAALSDGKWERVLGPVWQAVARGIAGHLALPDPQTLVPAPNTHELVMRLLSCLPTDRVPRVLTSDGEFHSFRRQSARLSEDGLLEVTSVAAEPLASFQARFIDAAREGEAPDLIFVSQVFFNSGFALDDLGGLVAALSDLDSLIVIDGYHGFLARPTDLSGIAGRAFYLAGGYKYAMAGEGACFLHCPPGWAPRPRNTGWYAGFGALAKAQEGVPYSEDGWRFMGSTFDPSGLYRLRASLEWLAAKGLDAATIHAHARALQRRFVDGLAAAAIGPFDPACLVVPVESPAIGNFLTFRNADAESWQKRLHDLNVVVDSRGDRLRVGFGLYQTAGDVDRLLDRLRRASL